MPFRTIRWVYLLREDFTYNILSHLPPNWASGFVFYDVAGHPRFELHSNGDARVLSGYAWDGCTPKWALLDLVVGVPDGVPHLCTGQPKTYYASLLHDALCQFLELNPAVPRATADRIFLELLTRDEFALRKAYYFAVLVFGRMSYMVKKRTRKYGGRRVPLEGGPLYKHS